MTDKAVISDYTYRSLESQRATFAEIPAFVLPDDLSQLFRKTTRKTLDCLHVESFAVLARTEDELRDFLTQAKNRKAKIFSREDNQTFVISGNVENLVKWWRDARRKGSAKIGAQRGADKKKAAVAERAKGLTKDEWTNGEVKNAQLVEKYGASINALKRYASSKGWGWDRQKATWERERRYAKN